MEVTKWLKPSGNPCPNLVPIPCRNLAVLAQKCCCNRPTAKVDFSGIYTNDINELGSPIRAFAVGLMLWSLSTESLAQLQGLSPYRDVTVPLLRCGCRNLAARPCGNLGVLHLTVTLPFTRLPYAGMGAGLSAVQHGLR